MITFTVLGVPQPAGSKKAFVRGGRAIIVDDAKGSRPWKQQVAGVALDAMQGRDMLTGPVGISMTFWRRRPKGHMGAGRNAAVVKASAPAHPITKPDALKLARAVEDALTGICYSDDAVIVDEHLAKRFGPHDQVTVTIWEFEAA